MGVGELLSAGLLFAVFAFAALICATPGPAVFLKQLGGHPDKRDRAAAVLDGRTWTETPEPVKLGGR